MYVHVVDQLKQLYMTELISVTSNESHDKMQVFPLLLIPAFSLMLQATAGTCFGMDSYPECNMSCWNHEGYSSRASNIPSTWNSQ